MFFNEIEKYKVECIINIEELTYNGLTLDDILERRPEAWTYLRQLRSLARSHTSYEWPDCAYSMQINVLSKDSLAITFSETIEDFIYGLKQSQMIMDNESGSLLSDFIEKLDNADESEARVLIKSFESNVRNMQ